MVLENTYTPQAKKWKGHLKHVIRIFEQATESGNWKEIVR